MNVPTLPPDVGPQFIDIGVERGIAIMSTIEAGWRRAIETGLVDAHAGELEITECLRDGMRRALNQRVANWCKRVTVLPGTESRSGTASLRPDGRTDIPIYFQDVRETYDDHDPHAIIECKRVAGTNAALCRLYVVEGVERFRTGQYSHRHVVAFMAAYVLSGSIHAATGGINRYLSGRGRAAECLNQCTVLTAAWARSSRHSRRPPTAPIDLHHAFLVFPALR